MARCSHVPGGVGIDSGYTDTDDNMEMKRAPGECNAPYR